MYQLKDPEIRKLRRDHWNFLGGELEPSDIKEEGNYRTGKSNWGGEWEDRARK